LPANPHGGDLYLVPLQGGKMMDVLLMDAKKMRRDDLMDAMSYRVPNLRDAVDHPFSFSSI
jgi:hypothetical protein